jgi:UDP-GlcNAc:undecaprenyl-phosphate GlcNAc-1-phosphate transferase
MGDYLAVTAAAAVVTMLLTAVVRRLALRLGWVPPVRDRDMHSTPTPRFGGLAMLGGLAAALELAKHLPGLSTAFHPIASLPHGSIWVVLGAGALISLLGAVDDKNGVDPFLKLGGQAGAGALLPLFGLRLTWLPVPGYGPVALSPAVGFALTVLLVLITVNAVNFADGLDGLAAGLVGIAALAFFGFAYRLSTGFDFALIGTQESALLAVILVGMCLGFLAHNWAPASIFMGDSGSLLLGLVLAATTICFAGGIDPQQFAAVVGSRTFATHKSLPVYIPVIVPLTCLSLPFLDLFLAVVRRTRAGKHPWAPDALHMHHRMVQLGHSKRRAVLVLYFWAALFAFVPVLMSVTTQHQPYILGALALTFCGLLLLLPPATGRRRGRASGVASAMVPGPRREPTAPAPQPADHPSAGGSPTGLGRDYWTP